MTGILYLAPSIESGRNVCAFASPGCAAACLFTAGRGRFDKIKKARIAKTHRFQANREEFLLNLEKDIIWLIGRASRKGFIPAVRLNGTSDLPWENLRLANGQNLMERFPDVQFYDYTKNVKRAIAWTRGELPANYHITFSRSETNGALADLILSLGGNVAVVFDKIISAWNGFAAVNGDESDLRFLDPKNVVVALKAKGKAKLDKSGFVVYTGA